MTIINKETNVSCVDRERVPSEYGHSNLLYQPEPFSLIFFWRAFLRVRAKTLIVDLPQIEVIYADDIDYISSDEKTLNYIRTKMPDVLEKWFIKINTEKTETTTN